MRTLPLLLSLCLLCGCSDVDPSSPPIGGVGGDGGQGGVGGVGGSAGEGGTGGFGGAGGFGGEPDPRGVLVPCNKVEVYESDWGQGSVRRVVWAVMPAPEVGEVTLVTLCNHQYSSSTEEVVKFDQCQTEEREPRINEDGDPQTGCEEFSVNTDGSWEWAVWEEIWFLIE